MITTDWVQQYAERQRRFADEIFPANKAAILAALKEAGVTKATAEFQGGGDSGAFEDVTFEPEPTTQPVVSLVCSWNGAPNAESLREAVITFGFDVIKAAGHDGWENNDGASGAVTIDVEAGTAVLDIDVYYSDSNHYEHAF